MIIGQKFWFKEKGQFREKRKKNREKSLYRSARTDLIEGKKIGFKIIKIIVVWDINQDKKAPLFQQKHFLKITQFLFSKRTLL